VCLIKILLFFFIKLLKILDGKYIEEVNQGVTLLNDWNKCVI